MPLRAQTRVTRLNVESLESRTMFSATVLHVNTTADVVDESDAFLSLREAVLVANASPGDEEIILPAGHYELTRTGANEDFSQTGDLDIRDNGSLKIFGAGRDETIIDAGPLMVESLGFGDRVLDVHQAMFEIHGLTVTGGTQAGALTNTGGVVSISAATFIENHTIAGAGAIINRGVDWNPHGWMSIDDTLFIDNSGNAGGIQAFTDTIVTNSQFERNRGGYLGGAILAAGQYNPRVEVRNSRFVENEAIYGGAIQAFSLGTLLIANSTFERNHSDAGGAIIAIDAQAVILSSTFDENRARDGGAILVVRSSPVLVADCLIANNIAERSGGGIWGRALVWNSTISHNQAYEDGGGIAENARVYGSTIVGNRADADGNGSGSGSGGGLYEVSKLHNSVVIGNLLGAAGADVASDVGLPVAESSHNLVGDPATAGGLIDGLAGNIVGDGGGGLLEVASVLDPNLDDHGGLTRAYLLAPGSPAIDAGNSMLSLQAMLEAQPYGALKDVPLPSGQFDQRGPGYLRRVGESVDIGAVESGARFSAAVDMPRVFYNNSLFDGGGAENSLLNILSLDYRKHALLPNGTLANASHITNYSRGINGIMFDLAGSHPNVSVDDFNFRTGVTTELASWATAPEPESVEVLSGLGSGGADLVVITWPDGAIKNTYLQVIVAANVDTGLAEENVFFFGNRVGDSFNTQPPASFVTSAADEIAARNAHPKTYSHITNPLDFDKSGSISAADMLIARNNGGFLPRIQIGSPVPTAAPAATSRQNAIAGGLTLAGFTPKLAFFHQTPTHPAELEPAAAERKIDLNSDSPAYWPTDRAFAAAWDEVDDLTSPSTGDEALEDILAELDDALGELSTTQP